MPKRPTKLSAQILDEASAWFTELTAGDLDTAAQAEFNTWLRRSPEHVQAYLQIAAFWEDAEVLKTPPAEDFEGLIARARQERNVYPLELAAGAELALSNANTAPAVPAAATGDRRRSPGLVALAASIILAVLATGAAWMYLQRGVYTTDIGEQRSFTLDDGSSIELNARSRLKVRFTAQHRTVDLLQGQALFRVAKDAARPFVVESGGARVRAVGTQFDVYRKNIGTIVTVVEGRVVVAAPSISAPEPATSDTAPSGANPAAPSDAAPQGEVLLQAGEQLTVSTETAPARPFSQPRPRRTNIASATAWIEKKLVFDGAPLRDVVEEFNRYNRQQLVIHDPSVYEFHISGVFSSTDSARILEVLRRRFGVTVRQTANNTIEITPGTDDPDAH